MNSPLKWFAGGLGALIGIGHIGMIGMISKQNNIPVIQPPTGPYSSYVVSASKDGYKMSYTANDPKTMHITKDITKPSGFLGFGKSKHQIVEEYVMDGKTNQGGAVSNHRPWQDGSVAGFSAKKLDDRAVECIKSEGGGAQTGRVVGASMGAAAAPVVSGIPFVGPVLAGLVALGGADQGAKIGGEMATSFSEACQEDVDTESTD